MFPFWEPVILPVLAAAGVRSVVEIGSLRGDTTRQLVDAMGPDGVLHVIDPAPGFDPSEHEREAPGRYVFHRGLSVDVLPDLPPSDAALIDGDHNWYTVTQELALLDQTARTHRAPLPILVLHDVGWPYGRRDLYYDPETIPAEHRHPHARAGMRPGRSDLLPEGQGMSQGLWNAVVEGGPRNGVMTALDDFVAASDRQLRVVILPLYFGLAIVAEDRLLAAHPSLVQVLDRLEGPEGRRAQIELGEHIRLRAVAHHHTVARRTGDRHQRLVTRYLDGVLREVGGGRSLSGLRAALDELEVDGPPGDVVIVIADDDPSPAVLARAHLSAFDHDERAVWLVVAARAAEVEASLRSLLERLDLVGPVHVVVEAGGGTLPEGLVSAALVHVGPSAGGPEDARDPWRRALVPDGRWVTDGG